MSKINFDEKDNSWVFHGGMAIDADGSARAYNADDTGLEFLANGGPEHAPYGYELNHATGKPFVQGEDAPAASDATKGFYVSATTYENREYAANDPMRYLDSEKVRYVVVPNSFRRHVPGVVLGCKCLVSFNGKTVEAGVGDIGPDFGEASIATANALGIQSNPRHGGTGSGVEYRFYPGVVAEGFKLQPA